MGMGTGREELLGGKQGGGMRSTQKYIHRNIYQNIYRIIYQIVEEENTND